MEHSSKYKGGSKWPKQHKENNLVKMLPKQIENSDKHPQANYKL